MRVLDLEAAPPSWLTPWKAALRPTISRRAPRLMGQMLSGAGLAVSNLGLAAIAYPLYLRYLGYELYGLWLVLGVVASFSQFGNLGIATALTKKIAEAAAHGDWDKTRALCSTATMLVSISGCAILSIAWLLRTRLPIWLSLKGNQVALAETFVPLMAILTFVAFQTDVTIGIISGLGKIHYSNVLLLAARMVTLGTCSVAVAFHHGLAGMFTGTAAGYLVTILAGLLCIRRMAPIGLLRPGSCTAATARELLMFGGGLFFSSMLNLLLGPFNELLVNRYAGAAAVPLCDIAYSMGMQLRSIFETSCRAIIPAVSFIAAGISSACAAQVRQINNAFTLAVLAAAVFPFGIFFAFAPAILSRWLGSRYNPVLPGLFRTILIGTMVSTLAVVPYYVLVATGRLRAVITAQSIQAGANVGIGLVAVHLFPSSALGSVSFAAGAGLLLGGAYQLLMVRRVPEPGRC